MLKDLEKANLILNEIVAGNKDHLEWQTAKLNSVLDILSPIYYNKNLNLSLTVWLLDLITHEKYPSNLILSSPVIELCVKQYSNKEL